MNETQQFGSAFCLRWVLLTSVGYALGFLGGFVMGHFVLGNVMVGIGIATLVGTMQWFALRSTPLRPDHWVLATIAGIAIGMMPIAAASTIFGFRTDLSWPFGVLTWAIALGVGGAVAGLLQRRCLQPHLRDTNWWVAASAVGWSCSALGLAIPADMSGQAAEWGIPFVVLRNGMLAPAVAGLILGAVTASALWLPRRSRSLPAT